LEFSRVKNPRNDEVKLVLPKTKHPNKINDQIESKKYRIPTCGEEDNLR
jgi:hypothetical protein